MERLLLVAVAGLLATLVDGSLGMGFGPTSSTILLGIGLAPAAVSFTVNLAKIATGIIGGAAHWRFGNIDRRLVILLAGPGSIGALVGVTLLSSIPADSIRPVVALLLSAVAIRMLIRYARTPRADQAPGENTPVELQRRQVMTAGFLGGITNGLIGAWGPVATPVALHQRGIEPRIAIGSVNIAEIAVALTASLGLFGTLGTGTVDVKLLGALLVGGSIAAPIAAWVVKHLPQRALGISVAALLLFTNTRDLSGLVGLGDSRWIAYSAIGGAAVLVGNRRFTSSGATTPDRQPTPAPAAGTLR